MKNDTQENGRSAENVSQREHAQSNAALRMGKPQHIASEEVILDAMGAFNILARNAVMENRSNLTKTQADIIIGLSLDGKASMTTIARNLAVSKEHVTRAISGLVEQGLVEKNRSHDNFRAIEATLTEKGQDAARSLRMQSIRKLNERLSAFSEEDLESLLRAAETAADIIRKYNA